LLVAAYVWGSWLLSPIFRPSPVGSDSLPHNVWLTVRICEALGGVTGLAVFIKFVLMPVIREKHIPTDGLMVINFLLIWWMDPMVNYFNFSFTYNSHTFNMGSWASFIPGASYPNLENFPEPLLMMGGFYLGFWMLTALAGCWLIRKMLAWRPGIRPLSCLVVVFIAMFIIDMLIELLILRTGLAAYPGVWASFSIFPGQVYQWPLYEGVGVGLACVGFTALRFYKDDKGQTFVEKGIDRLKISSSKKRIVRFLALAGAIQPMMLLGFYVTYNVFLLHIDTFPAYPSYMRNEICGEGTTYACPNKYWVPIPNRRTQIVVAPDDPRLPETVRNMQGISGSGKDPYIRE
ncbi:MAG: spirocyclase AveC family protein, partial [Desulfatitalea sp.]|nr:spirocyclase AveC family protein [Desulfatitalea sp.]NNK00867.1 spirocyclase AveC family protein [Desulfatitalea sp.]